MEEKEQKLRELLENLGKLVPTLLFIGKTTDKHRAFMMDSPEDTDEKRKIDLIASVAMMMDQQQALRDVIFSAVSWFMQENPKYRDGMQEALNILKELDEHQRTAEKVEPKFKVKYAGSEYNVLEIKKSAGVIYYGIEDEPNHIDYIKADNCEIINGGYGVKEDGFPFPTKPVIFSEKKELNKIELKTLGNMTLNEYQLKNNQTIMEENKKELQSLLTRLGEIVPTLLDDADVLIAALADSMARFPQLYYAVKFALNGAEGMRREYFDNAKNN